MTINLTQSPTFAINPEAALAAYEKNGYHLEPNVLSAAQCDALIASAQQLPSYQDGSLVPVMNPHRLDPVFLMAQRIPQIVAIVEQLLGGAVSGLQTQFFFCRPGTPGFTMHQDNYYVQSLPDTFASAWLALEDVDSENGGLVMYPGSHREPVLPVEQVEQLDNWGQDPNANCRQVILPPQYHPANISVPKGGVVFIHGHVVHKSYQNTSSDRFRHALLMLYVRRGAPFRPGYAAGRTEIEVYG